MSLRRSFSKIIFDLSGKDKIEEYFDFIDYDPLNTTADITRVYVRIDGDASAFRLSDVVGTFVVGRRLEITCEPDQIGKRLALVLGKEYRYWSTRGRFELVRESIGLMNVLNKLTFDANNNLKGDIANAEIMIPSDIQAVLKDKTTLFSGTVSANGNTADIDMSRVSVLEIELKVTGVSGTNPVLSVYVEGKFEDSGDYKPLVYQENITSTGIWFFTITKLAFRYIRVRWVVGGTSPSFTFAVYVQMLVM